MRNGWNNPHKPVYHYLDLSDLNNESEYGYLFFFLNVNKIKLNKYVKKNLTIKKVQILFFILT